MGWFERRLQAVSVAVFAFGLWATVSGFPTIGIGLIVLCWFFID